MIFASRVFTSRRIRHGRDARDTVTLLVLLVLAAPALFAQPVPSLKSVSPDVLQRGHTTTLTLTGENIADASQALLVGPQGLVASIKPDPAPPTTKPATSLTVEIAAAADAPRGLRELRLLTPAGVTKAVLLSVDDLPAVAEREPNNSTGEAQAITLPAIVSGKIQAELDVDCFKFDAKKGQRLIFDVQAFRTGSKLDASLALFDSTGRRVAHDEDTNGLDPLIDFTVPADGQYTLRIQDLQFKGGGDFAYRIRAGEIPYVDAIFPLGGQRGQHVAVELKGRNLAGMKRMSMALDPSDPGTTRDLEAPTPAGLTNTRPFAVSDLPEVNEDAAAAAARAPLAAPVIVNGKIGKAGETDAFKFKSAAAGPLVLEIAAARFGSRLDALLTLTDENGAVIQRNDDAAGADARIQFAAEKDKVYGVAVRDLTDHGGDDYAYRLSIAPPRAQRGDFDVALLSDADVRLNRGGRAMLRAAVTRKAGFASDVTVTLFPLPPGVTCKPLVVPATQPSSGIFTLTAAPDAPAGFHPLTVVATAMVGDEMITRTTAPHPALKVSPLVYLTVHGPAPFRIERLGPVAETDPKKLAEQVAALEKTLATQTPQLDAAQAKWEKALNPASTWEVLDVADAKAASGAKLVKQPDGSLKAEGAVPAVDKYTVTAKAPAAPIRFVRLEAIATNGHGPGRAENGNFVLSHFTAALAGGAPPIEFSAAKADFSQAGFGPEDSINPKPDSGWAVAPELGKSHFAVYTLKAPVTPAAGATITFTLDQSSNYAQHVLGQFRILTTAAEKPDGAAALPANVAAVVKAPAEGRTKEQRDALAAYYRSIAPELQPTREKLASLKSPKGAFPPVLMAPNAGKLELALARDPGFEGDVVLTVEGFSSGIDDATKQPATFAKSFDFQPVTLKAKESQTTLGLRPRNPIEKGTRDAIVRAETTVNGAKYVVYSQTFPITVK